QSVGALDLEFCGEPGPSQHPALCPVRRSCIVLRSEMLSQCCQESVPSIVPDWGRLIPQQRQLNVVSLPAVFLKELPHELPPHFDVRRPNQAVGEISQSHGTVAGHEGPPLLCARGPSIRRCVTYWRDAAPGSTLTAVK